MVARLRPVRFGTDALEDRLLLAAGSFVVSPVAANVDPLTLINALLGPNSNITVVPGSAVYRGADGQAGTFIGLNFTDANSGTALTLPDGILLTSGGALLAEANDETSAGEGLNADGDDDLGLLIPGTSVNDANVLEFDFTVPSSMKSIQLQFIFGSDEFPEFVGQFNDVLGVFLDDQQIAFDDDGDPLTVNNNFFLLNNDLNADPADPVDSDTVGKTAVNFPNIEYDGLTRPLTTAAPLNTNLSVHHLKIAIADAGDDSLDSGALLARLMAITDVIDGPDTGDDIPDENPPPSPPPPPPPPSPGPDPADDADISFAASLITATPPPTLVFPSLAQLLNFAPIPPAASLPGQVVTVGLPSAVSGTPFESFGSGGDSRLRQQQQNELALPRPPAADNVLANFVEAGNRRVAVDQEIESLLTNLADADQPHLLAMELGDEVVKKPAATVKEVLADDVAQPPAVAGLLPVPPAEAAAGWSKWWLLGLVPASGILGKLAWTHRRRIMGANRKPAVN